MIFQDYHLAKRYYDLAAETSAEAHVPVALALINLNLQYYYDSFLKVHACRVNKYSLTHSLIHIRVSSRS